MRNLRREASVVYSTVGAQQQHSSSTHGRDRKRAEDKYTQQRYTELTTRNTHYVQISKPCPAGVYSSWSPFPRRHRAAAPARPVCAPPPRTRCRRASTGARSQTRRAWRPPRAWRRRTEACSPSRCESGCVPTQGSHEGWKHVDRVHERRSGRPAGPRLDAGAGGECDAAQAALPSGALAPTERPILAACPPATCWRRSAVVGLEPDQRVIQHPVELQRPCDVPHAFVQAREHACHRRAAGCEAHIKGCEPSGRAAIGQLHLGSHLG